MAPLLTLITSACLFVLAVGAPAAPVQGPQPERRGLADYVLKQVETGSGRLRSGTHAIVRTYQRYGATVPPPVLRAQSAQNDSVAASPEQYDGEYLVPVALGSKGTILNMNLDTGSADFWAFSSFMPKEQLQGKSYYDPGASRTSKKLDGQSWTIKYGDGSTASGGVYTDKAAMSNVTAAQQGVQTATEVSAMFLADIACDGIVGLGFSNMNRVSPQPQRTFMDNVKGGLKHPVFAVDLKRGAPGSYQFGDVDPSKYIGRISYAAAHPQRSGHWQFDAAGYAVGGAAVTAKVIDTVVDTGSSLNYLPSDVVAAYYKQVQGATYDATDEVGSGFGGWTFPCDAKQPDFVLAIGGYRATMPGSYNNFSPVQDGSNKCFGAIQTNEGLDFSLLGASFIKSQYVVFNADDKAPSIGFAAKNL